MGSSIIRASVPSKGGGHLTIDPWNYHVIGQGSYALIFNATYMNRTAFFNSTTNDGDNYTLKAYLSAGTYNMIMYVGTNTNGGKIDVYIDAAKISTVDTYATSAICNVKKVESSIIIGSSGLKDIKLLVNGHHVSSSAYACQVHTICFYKTA